MNIDLNNNKSTVIDEMASMESSMTSAILPTVDIIATSVSESTNIGGQSSGDQKSTNLSLGVSVIGAGVAGINEMIDVTARMQNPKNPSSVYGSDGKIVKGMFRGVGYGLGAYNAYSIEGDYKDGLINKSQRNMEQTSNIISTVGGIYGAVWGIGWELGRAITNIPGYHENVRLPVQQTLGIVPRE